MDWNTSFAAQMGQATDMVRNGNLMEATQAIQKALNGGAAAADTPAASPAMAAKPRRAKAAWRTAAAPARGGGLAPGLRPTTLRLKTA